jgi:hypothetical protein
MPTPLPTTIDAYCHVGLPRFGSAADALTILEQNAIRQAVLVLGPQVPDYETLFAALKKYKDRVRGIGIPFGETPEQVLEVTEMQLQAGVIGLRVDSREVLANPEMLTRLGQAGSWLYAINPLASPELMQTLLDWLEAYPAGRIAAPHFLQARPLLIGTHGDDLIRVLVSHPRFYPIFSRHGNNGSQFPYPHLDFRQWVAQVVALTGWERIMWGSEYPVLYWRDETVVTCQGWLTALGVSLTEAELAHFLGGNAQRLLFDETPLPPQKKVTIPAWVEAQFNRQRTVPLFQGQGLEIPMALYQTLHADYVQALQQDPALTFGAFVVGRLGVGI